MEWPFLLLSGGVILGTGDDVEAAADRRSGLDEPGMTNFSINITAGSDLALSRGGLDFEGEATRLMAIVALNTHTHTHTHAHTAARCKWGVARVYIRGGRSRNDGQPNPTQPRPGS
uniref:Putative secreted protein n=1 Tax=Anopheles marajoara TaxID=58244 RepID=A0A2M4C7K0_9DIPT